MLVITSAGDNALHYAINARPKRVSSVGYPWPTCTNLRREDPLR